MLSEVSPSGCWTRLVIRMVPRTLLWLLGIVGVVGGSLILVICGVASYPLRLAKELFLLCLLIECVLAALLHKQRGPRLAGLVAASFLALSLTSLLPVYVAHWTPQDGRYHRHTLWNFDHVH